MNQIFFSSATSLIFCGKIIPDLRSFVAGWSSHIKEFFNFRSHLFWACFGTKIVDNFSFRVDNEFGKVPRDVFNFSFLADRFICFLINLIVLQIFVDRMSFLSIHINFREHRELYIELSLHEFEHFVFCPWFLGSKLIARES